MKIKPMQLLTMLAGSTYLASFSTPAALAAGLGLIEEVVVTAQKREQSINDVSLSVAAFGGDQLDKLRVADINDLSGLVAGLDIGGTLAGQNPRIAVRGVGLNDFNSNNSSSVGVYIDEVFQVSQATLGFMLFDLERVEVLKGPQGTLYGRNSNGGAINVVTARPTEEFEASVKAGYADYDTSELEGVVSGPLGDKIQGRIAARYLRQGETYYDKETTGDDFGDSETFGLRAQLATSNDDGFSADIKIEYFDNDSALHPVKVNPILNPDGSGALCAPALSGTSSRKVCDDGSAFFFPGLPLEQLFSDLTDDPYKRQEPVGTTRPMDGSDGDMFAATLNIYQEYDTFGLTSVTGYQTSERDLAEGWANELEMAAIYHNDEIDMFSQELRLDGSTNTANWVVGVFYSSDEVKTDNVLDSRDYLGTSLPWTVDQDTETAALFANVDWNLSDNMRLSTGLRYSWEEREFVGGTRDLDTFGFGCISEQFGLTGALCTPLPGGGFQLTFQDDKLDETDLSYRIGLDYKPNEDWLVYGNVSTAFKSGGWFGDFTFEQHELEPYDPEEILAYELGFKGTLSNDLQWNGAAFYYDYEDIQTLIPGPLAFKFDNAPKAEVIGIETELFWVPLEGLDIQATASWLDTEMDAFGVVPSGNVLPNAPELSTTLLVRYEFPVSTNYNLALSTDMKYTDSLFREATNDPLAEVDSRTIVNASLSLLSSDDKWELMLWGRNITDETYEESIFVAPAFGVQTQYFNTPATYGLTLQARF